MNFSQIRNNSWRIYWWIETIFVFLNIILGGLAALNGPIHVSKIVISENLSFLMAFTAQIPLFLVTVLRIFTRSYISTREHWKWVLIGVFFCIAFPANIILTVLYVVHNPQDLATLAIVWAFVAAGLLFVGKNILTGILGAIGGAIAKPFLDKAMHPDDKNTDDKNTAQN